MRAYRHGLLVAAAAVLLLCAGCSGWQSAMDPGGPAAATLKSLIWTFVITCGVIWVLVMLVLTGAIWRRRTPGTVNTGPSRTASVLVGTAVAASVVVIAGLTLLSFFVTRSIAAGGADRLVIQVRGHQWWWEVIYQDQATNQNFITANEIHIPIGRPVRVELAAEDVIHSFWAPNLIGKQDLIPGRSNALTFIADRPGVFRQQCAEFCGLQHAHMAMVIIAELPEAFTAWRAAQVAEAASPSGADEQTGRQVFLGKPCAACHTIRGTSASGTIGPDLTHVGSRRFIASGMLPTTRGSLAAWTADPQTIKPGNNMPMIPLTATELNAVAAYLATLK
ncbi:MAG: cytochrome c oxidase subunit II [Rhodopila sp.]